MKYLINIVSNVVKISAGFIFFLFITKYNSVESVGYLGQLLTFSAAIMMVATLGIQNKLIQDVSKNINNIDINYLLSIVLISLFFLVLVLIFGKIFFYNLSLRYGGTSNLVFFIFVTITFILAVFTQFKIAIYNGTENYKKLAEINILSSIMAVIVAYVFLDIFKGAEYQFFLIMLYPCFKVLFVFFPVKINNKTSNYVLKNIRKVQILDNIKSMLPFIIMATVSVIIIYGYQYSVRILIANEIDWVQVGQWQILQKHSEVVSLFFTSIAGVFIIPKLAKVKFRDQLILSKKFAILLFTGGLIGLVFVKLVGSIYIERVFGSEYATAGGLLFIHLIGDVFKVVAYCFCITVLCNSWVKLYIVLELIQYFLLILSYKICFSYFGSSYMAHAYTLAYFLYMTGVVIYLVSFKKDNSETPLHNLFEEKKI